MIEQQCGRSNSNRYFINVERLKKLQFIHASKTFKTPDEAIVKGANGARFEVEREITKGATDDIKGATDDTKGANGAPNTLITLDTSINSRANGAKPAKKTSKKAEKETNPEVAVFIEGWCDIYEPHWGHKYTVQGWRDGKAIKDLLAASKSDADSMLELVTRAWSNQGGFWCQKSISITSFCSRINEVKAELAKTGDIPESTKRNNLPASMATMPD